MKMSTTSTPLCYDSPAANVGQIEDRFGATTVEVEIRRLQGMLDALFERVAEDVFDAPVQRDRLARFLSDDRTLLVVAIIDGGIVGQGRAYIHKSPEQPDELYIDNLGVTPSLWRRGIGGRLFDELVAWGRERGCDRAWLATEPGNVEARALYESRGATTEQVLVYGFSDLDAIRR